MAPRRRAKPDEHGTRIRHLIALDATNVMRRLIARRDEMVSLFSRLRTREPMLEVVQSWFGTIGFPDLAALGVKEQSAANAFYESLGELRWYLRYTEDMPSTVKTSALLHQRKLVFAYERLVRVLGSPSADGAPVVDADIGSAPVAALAKR